MCHDDLPGLSEIRTFLNHTVQEDCLVMIDDDLRGIIPQMSRRQRHVTDPAVIAQVIENGHRISEDLGITLFCWSRTQNNFLANPELEPIRVVQPVSSSFGVRGAWRERSWDPRYGPRHDIRLTLETLLLDRILLADMRWYFDHGRMFSGKGGNVTSVNSERWKKGTEFAYKQWGKYIGRSSPGFFKHRTTEPMSIRVTRHNPLARN